MENYESEFQAPIHSVVHREIIGQKVITRVVMDGEIVEFEALRETVAAGKELEDK